MTTCRLIIDPPAPGAWNMAVDEALLIEAAERGIATLRFYGWSEPTLSLGYFQRRADRRQHAPSRDCAVVRRATGGGAILHDRELTYSVSLPTTHPFARQTERLFVTVHDAFIRTLAAALETSWDLTRYDDNSGRDPTDEPFLCFERRACGDVLLSRGGDAADRSWKILGSAQRRHRGAVLQHGSLLLETSPVAPELPGVSTITGRPLSIDEIAAAVSVQLGECFGVRPIRYSLSPELESKSRELANNKYDSPDWTHRR